MKVVFDTEALLAFYLGEEGGERVKAYLEGVQRGELEGLVSIVSLAELYYILYRRSPPVAEEKERNLRAYGVKVVPVLDDELWREAAKVKGQRAIPLADAFAAATARVEGARLVVGSDEHFKGLGIELEAIR